MCLHQCVTQLWVQTIVAPYGLGVYTVHSKIRVYSTLAVLPIMHYCIIRCVGIIRCTVLYAYIRRLQESKHRMVQLWMKDYDTLSSQS